ncbi:hypothetical protein [Reichenbachiella ulvae]|uniref:Uncharacterized protein n=1 Tax=Reichenbachiella ulvae TaxID=2980104 RepID=A0ABT3CW33_9BACT|nr:hypothetical protein [Reichenbachiella ulvae]MCV9387754.1 hypothetical protein [Reichenbachiella ulvae]
MNISTKLKESILQERALKEELERIESQIPRLNEAIDEGESKYSWKDSFFSGYLGGNRALVISVNKMCDELDALEKRARDLKPQLKKLEKTVEKELISVASPLNPNLNSLLTEKERWLKLERKSKSYKNLVLKAEQGIKDALMFLSWEKLVNHPDAKSKLDEFKNETLGFQKIISDLSTEITALKGEVIVFEDLIQFSTQQVAMKSFRMLATKSNEYYKMAYDQVEKYISKCDDILEKVKSKVI